MDKDLSGIARFYGDEFHIWKWQIRGSLMYQRVLDLLDGTNLEYVATDEDAWKVRKYLAYPITCNLVEQKLLGSFLDCKTSREIWTTLLSTYELKTSENPHELQKKSFQAVIFLEQYVTNYVASVNLILNKLVALDDKTFNKDTMISKFFP
jgi:hypothetical protein